MRLYQPKQPTARVPSILRCPDIQRGRSKDKTVLDDLSLLPEDHTYQIVKRYSLVLHPDVHARSIRLFLSSQCPLEHLM